MQLIVQAFAPEQLISFVQELSPQLISQDFAFAQLIGSLQVPLAVQLALQSIPVGQVQLEFLQFKLHVFPLQELHAWGHGLGKSMTGRSMAGMESWEMGRS